VPYSLRYDGAATQLTGHAFGASATSGKDEKFVLDDVRTSGG
jgi:hypothetical protein